jgi:hypothetical protein
MEGGRERFCPRFLRGPRHGAAGPMDRGTGGRREEIAASRGRRAMAAVACPRHQPWAALLSLSRCQECSPSLRRKAMEGGAGRAYPANAQECNGGDLHASDGHMPAFGSRRGRHQGLTGSPICNEPSTATRLVSVMQSFNVTLHA